jgi:signal transduction histidine kinase
MKFALSQKIGVTLIGILLLASASSGVALVWAWRTEQAFRQMLTHNLEQARAVYELEIALLEQGLSTSLYLMGGDSERLTELRRSRPEFEVWLARAQALDLQAEQEEFADRIAQLFAGYEAKSRQVLALYAAGDPEQAKQLWLEQALEHHDRVYRLCEGLSLAHTREAERAILARKAQVRRMNLWVGISLSVLAGLIAGLSLFLSRSVLRPLHRLAGSLGRGRALEYSGSSPQEIRSLGLYIDSLRDEVAEMHSQLSLNQRRLLDAEKLASVGKLAASVAHEIRSPLTSLRLRVFSVHQALADSHRQRDLQLISDEITRLDNIVRNVLEFAKPRQPALQPCDVHGLLDHTVELLAYKLEATSVAVERQDDPSVSTVGADSQQLTQVFVNLLNNAIEALPRGGTIRIRTRLEKDPGRDEIVRIFVQDSGPGIPRELQDSIFDPFFGTKDESTGLGLWIAKRIMNEHGGDLALELSPAPGPEGRCASGLRVEGKRSPSQTSAMGTPTPGATFSLWLPVGRGEENEQDPGR